MEQTTDLLQVTDKLSTISLCFTIFFNLEIWNPRILDPMNMSFMSNPYKLESITLKFCIFFVDMEKWIWN